MTLELHVHAETSGLLSATMQMHQKSIWEGFPALEKYGICQLCRFIFDWKLISYKTIFGMQPVFPSPPPHEPHPPPSVLWGLLATHEAVLEVRRTGPGPSVSPRLKGCDYMEN